MAKIDLSRVQHLAKLARIRLTASELKHFTAEIERILSLVEQLQAVDTKSVQPTSQVTGLVDVWRSDTVKPAQDGQALLLTNAPASQDGYLKVKRVL